MQDKQFFEKIMGEQGQQTAGKPAFDVVVCECGFVSVAHDGVINYK